MSRFKSRACESEAFKKFLKNCYYESETWNFKNCACELASNVLFYFSEGKEIEEQIDLPASDGPDDWVPISSTLSPPFSPGSNQPFGFVGRILDFISDIFGYGKSWLIVINLNNS